MTHRNQQTDLTRVLVTGDLNIDIVSTGVVLGCITRLSTTRSAVGGSAFNAAIAFKQEGLAPIVVGTVGKDVNGDRIRAKLQQSNIAELINIDDANPTGTCNILFFTGNEPRTIYYPAPNANSYDRIFIRNALARLQIRADDFIFSPFHLFDQMDRDQERCRAFFDELRASGARIILDIVPHTVYEFLDLASLRYIIGGPVFQVIAEYRTFLKFMKPSIELDVTAPAQANCLEIAKCFEAEYFDCRYGMENLSHQIVFRQARGGVELLRPARETGYLKLSNHEKPGFGDLLTARTLTEILQTER